jgi:para-nitrobenzyl esterase
MQTPFPSDAAPLGVTPAEDCLYLNVWKPAELTAPLPVMVWIYGGGFVNGGSSPSVYSGAALASEGVVVVSFNYRVGRFGTFAHPQLTQADEDDGRLANYGFMDQLAALQWVQKNIAAFGGDPANVTIVGESAGGMSVHAMITSPLSAGLFQKAVIQSGGTGSIEGGDLASAEAVGLTFAAQHAIAPTDPLALAKLRALSAEDVTDGLNMMALFAPSAAPRTFSSPIVDGRVAVDVADAYRRGAYHQVPLMIGATSDDIGGPDGVMIAGARTMTDLISRRSPVYYYRYDYVAESQRTPTTRGAGHATEIPFFFRTVDARYGAAATDRDKAASLVASTYLLNFVKVGDPNGGDLPVWRTATEAERGRLDFTPGGGAEFHVER